MKGLLFDARSAEHERTKAAKRPRPKSCLYLKSKLGIYIVITRRIASFDKVDVSA